MIRIVDYDPAWPARFVAEAGQLRRVLGARALRIDHVGSTSVPGLAAKPVIDIQVSVAPLQPAAAYAQALGQLGYSFITRGCFDLVYPFFQKPGDWPSTHHVHLCEAGGEQERLHLAFRDQLRLQPLLAADYVRLKRQLAAVHGGSTDEARERYSLGKTDFVSAALQQAAQRGRGGPVG